MPLPIGFFAPLAVPAMGAYLTWQNANMASAFGTHYKKGERRVGAMPNEAFAKENYAKTEKMLIDQQFKDMQMWTAAMPQFFQVARQLNIEIIGEFSKFLGDALAAFAQFVTGQTVTGLSGNHGVSPPTNVSDTEYLHDLGIGAAGSTSDQGFDANVLATQQDYQNALTVVKEALGGRPISERRTTPGQSISGREKTYYDSIVKMSQSQLERDLAKWPRGTHPYQGKQLIVDRLKDEYEKRKVMRTQHKGPGVIGSSSKPDIPYGSVQTMDIHVQLPRTYQEGTARIKAWNNLHALVEKSYNKPIRKAQIKPIKRSLVSRTKKGGNINRWHYKMTFRIDR